jgi:hypothetical protein
MCRFYAARIPSRLTVGLDPVKPSVALEPPNDSTTIGVGANEKNKTQKTLSIHLPRSSNTTRACLAAGAPSSPKVDLEVPREQDVVRLLVDPAAYPCSLFGLLW